MDSRDYLIEILKEKYYYELGRKGDFDKNLAISITIISFLVAGVFFVVNDQDLWTNYYCIKCWLYALLILIILGCLISYIFLFKVYFGIKRTYSSLPDSPRIVESYFKLHDHYKSLKKNKEEQIVSELRNFQIEWFNECNKANTATNDKRGNAFFNFKLVIGITLSLGVLLLITICCIKLYNYG